LAILCLLHQTHCAKTDVPIFFSGRLIVKYKSRIALKLVNKTRVFHFTKVRKDKTNSFIFGLLYLIDPKSLGINKSAWRE
jgi:hypothetical protein